MLRGAGMNQTPRGGSNHDLDARRPIPAMPFLLETSMDDSAASPAAGAIQFRIAGSEMVALSGEQLLGGLVGPGVQAFSVYSVYAQRSGERPVTVSAIPGRDVVVVKVAAGPPLVLHPENARALLASGASPRRGGGNVLADASGIDVDVGTTLPWNPDGDGDGKAVRGGGMAGAVLEWFGVMTIEDSIQPGRLAAQWIADQVDGQVHQGLYRLRRDLLPERFDPAEAITQLEDPAPGQPLLVLLHGTFVNTASTFGKLWEHGRAALGQVFDTYGERVFAFDHPTLGASPVENALALAHTLPEGARIHLLTHSRGGLVAEVLLRAAHEDLSGAALDPYFGAPEMASQRRDLVALSRLLHQRRILVERVVRIACPVRGTLLASKRLDAYLSVVHWLMRLAQWQVTPLLFGVLREIARQRVDPAQLPGLHAMMPDSPLIGWLNAPLDPVASSLYVIAGDSGGGGAGAWLKTLMADAFFWTDNDMVVQTRSMYGGVPRDAADGAARFRLMAGREVSHFQYFSGTESVAAIAQALSAAPGPDWKPIGLLSWLGKEAGGVRGAAAVPGKRVDCPAVLVLPDFFGSHLEDSAGRRLWLSPRALNDFGRLALPPAGAAQAPALVASALVEECYGPLCARLAETHEVMPFPYDWRLPLEAGADRLAALIADWLAHWAGKNRPLRIVAHGMGGLLVRALHQRHEKVWSAMMALGGVRVLMLGVPNAGSWTPLQALAGDDTFGDVLSAGGPLFYDLEARKALASMPGFIQLQAGLLDPVRKLDLESGWGELARIEQARYAALSSWHLPQDMWAIPPQALLTDARLFWARLQAARPDLAADADKIVEVVGTALHTPAELVTQDGRLQVCSRARGDGKVTLESARLLHRKLWRIDAEHGRMPVTVGAFAGLLELLNEGQTRQLESWELPAPGERPRPAGLADAKDPTRPFQHPSPPVPPASIADVFGGAAGDYHDHHVRSRLSVHVYHGDLRFLPLPLVVGHYRALSLSGSEAVVDSLVGRRMSKALRAGIYPERTGSYQIFENGRHSGHGRQKQRYIPRPRSAIIVGLGEEGKLNAQQLAYTIRIGILAYAERLVENGGGGQPFEIAATLIGSGGTGITVGNAALALFQAISDANVKLTQAGWPAVDRLTIVELYLDRATDAWRVLRLQAQTNPDRLHVAERLVEGEGGLRRPLDSSYRGATYDFITALQANTAEGAHPAIEYSLDTRRARTEVRAVHAQASLIRDLVSKASNSTATDPLIGRTLFNLLVPVEIEPYLAGSSDMVMQLDRHTSALPWELLDTDPDAHGAAPDGEAAPWAIRSKVIRKLQVEQYRAQVVDAAVEDNVLIVGEPLVGNSYGRLPGARREADAIAREARAMLGNGANRVTLLAAQNDAHTIINELFARNYRLVHIAGHGERGAHGGVVLSGSETFLGPNEIRAMRVTPELVFINCCHLAQRDGAPGYDRVDFAASVADALIQIGVRCVIAAGWAVEDEPAEHFAAAFYREIFCGARFIDAVGHARRVAWEANPRGNTWAAYQCYGDPDWNWRNEATAPPKPPAEEYAGVAARTTLQLVLETIATEIVYAPAQQTHRYRERLDYLEQNFKSWAADGIIAQGFGHAYAALPDRQRAIAFYLDARMAKDGGASLKAIELYAEQLSQPGARPDELKEAIKILESMLGLLAKTLMRHALLGHAWKRLSMHYADEHRRLAEQGDARAAPLWQEALQALEHARDAYASAAAAAGDDKYRFYPPRAVLMCELRRHLVEKRDSGLPPADWRERALADATRLVDNAAHADPNFWSIVAQSELDILKAVLKGRLKDIRADIEASLEDLHRRINTRRFWIYVDDDARFVLCPYIAMCEGRDAAEAEAAGGILARLGRYSSE